jgi:hypothetical protein
MTASPAGQQYVCDPTAVTSCPCAARDGDLGDTTCACAVDPDISGNCPECGSPMVLVAFDTGEPVAGEAKAS